MTDVTPFVHNKLKDVFLVYLNTCLDAGFRKIKAYVDGKELAGFSSVDPKTLTVTTVDVSSVVMRGDYSQKQSRPLNFKLVDIEKNELLVAWGDEYG